MRSSASSVVKSVFPGLTSGQFHSAGGVYRLTGGISDNCRCVPRKSDFAADPNTSRFSVTTAPAT